MLNTATIGRLLPMAMFELHLLKRLMAWMVSTIISHLNLMFLLSNSMMQKLNRKTTLVFQS